MLFKSAFPKLGLDGNHIGDGHVLCSDLPEDAFLREEAKYRLLGKSMFPELQVEGSILTLPASSSLREKLCNSDSHDCTYPGVVRLEENLSCTDSECEMRHRDVHVIKVNEDMYYEYIRPPCVDLSFLISNDDVVILVNEDGNVAMERIDSTHRNSFSHTFFRVVWKDHTFPSVSDNLCFDGVCQIFGAHCLCRVAVEESGVFSNYPSRSSVLSNLFIGGVPSAHMDNYRRTSHDNENMSIFIKANETISDMSSIFEVTDDFGRKKYMKNVKSNVIIQGGNQTDSPLSFRNPPTFLLRGPEIRYVKQLETPSFIVKGTKWSIGLKLTYPCSLTLLKVMLNTKLKLYLTRLCIIRIQLHFFQCA